MPLPRIPLEGYSTAQLLACPHEPASEPEADFPLGWYEEFLQEIVRREIRVLTFDDLFCDSTDWDYRSNYKEEYQHWMKHVRDRQTRYLVIQHDVDNHPSFTDRMVALEADYGVRSNIFIFHQRYSQKSNDADYPVDHAFLQTATRQGFVVGYHQNAFQRAGFNLERAADLYRSDLLALRKRHDIRYVVPHGGKGAEIAGRMLYNRDVPMPPEFERNLRWVFNGCCARMHRSWSDGGVRSSRDAKRLAEMDLIGSFLDEIRPGERAFCLVHPQRWGYHVNPANNPLLAAQPWYARVCQRHRVEKSRGDAA